MQASAQWTNYIPAILLTSLYFMIGFLALLHPVATLITAVYFVALIFIVTGLLMLLNAWGLFVDSKHRIWTTIDGVLALVVGGLFLFGNISFSINLLSYMLMSWFIVTSVIQLYILYTYKPQMRFLAMALDIIVITLAIYSLFSPTLATGVVVWSIALQFIFRGFSELSLLLIQAKHDRQL